MYILSIVAIRDCEEYFPLIISCFVLVTNRVHNNSSMVVTYNQREALSIHELSVEIQALVY